MLDEAFAELGLKPGASKAEIRKAYLRLLKTRPPETDPEGFQKLRAAYDTLNDALPVLAMMAARAAEAEAESDAKSKAEAERPSEAAPTDGAAEGAWRVVERPDEPDASPPPAPPPATPEPSPPLVSFAQTLKAAVEAKAWAEVAELICDELAAADREMRPSWIAPRSVVFLILEMRAARSHGSAQRVTRALADSVDKAGGDLHTFGSGFVPWIVVREFAELGSDIPSSIKTPMARALAANDLAVAREPLRAAREEFRGDVQRSFARAPLLAQLFGAMLAPDPVPDQVMERHAARAPTKTRGGGANPAWFIGPVIAVLIGIARLASTGSSANNPPYVPPRVTSTADTRGERARFGEPVDASPFLGGLRAAGSSQANDPTSKLIVDLLDRAGRALDRGNCAEASARLSEAEAVRAGGPSTTSLLTVLPVDARFGELRSRIGARCAIGNQR